jgi:iron complex transport system permease protein
MRDRYRKLGYPNAFYLVRPRAVFFLTVLTFVVSAGALSALAIGSIMMPNHVMMAWLRGQLQDEMLTFVIANLRLPRILLALLCGAALGAAGAAMQSATRNPLADPGLIGLKEGAVIAVIASMLFLPQLSGQWRPVIGIAGGSAVAASVMMIARSTSGLRFVLIGLGVSWLLSSAIALFMTMARISEVQTAMIWLGGSLHAASWNDLQLVFPWIVSGLAVMLYTSRSADAAMFGDMTAVSLGLRLKRLTILRLTASVVLTSTCASVVGGLGFVGLMAPHLARLCFGQQQATLIVGSSVLGAALVLAADTLGRTLLAPVQLPAGIVTAIVGMPMFMFLLWQRRDAI